MFDIETLRLTLAGVSMCVLALFYLGVYRPTHSKFAGWWTLALLFSSISPVLLLANGTDLQVLTNPLSSVITSMGGVCVWFATRSLRDQNNPRWVMLVVPMLVLIAAFMGSPATNIWAGNAALYLAMGPLFGLAGREMWIAWRARVSLNEDLDGEARLALVVSAAASGLLSVFYLIRFVLFVAVGPEDSWFEVIAGRGPATLILLVTLVAVAFSVSALGYDQQTRELRRRIAVDDLTGLLSRETFISRAKRNIDVANRQSHSALLVIADFDHFKLINDTLGHAAGDRALELFGVCAKRALSKGDLASRLGGEEFGMLFSDISVNEAVERLNTLAKDFALTGADEESKVPSVSFGISRADGNVSLTNALRHADMAMYDSKAAGRNRVSVDAGAWVASESETPDYD